MNEPDEIDTKASRLGRGVVDTTEPFYYGFRMVKTGPGKDDWEQVPLTADDVLHPREGDYVVVTYQHVQIVGYLREGIMAAALPLKRNVLVLSDTLIRWDNPDLRDHAPDIALIVDVPEQRPEWTVFEVAREGVRPVLIIEVTSRSTRDEDLGRKREQYAQAGVRYYIVVDGGRRELSPRWRLLGHELVGGQYVDMQPDAAGRLPLPLIDRWIGVENNVVRLYDAAGQAVPDYLAQTTARAEAEARVRELEERLRQLESRNGTT